MNWPGNGTAMKYSLQHIIQVSFFCEQLCQGSLFQPQQNQGNEVPGKTISDFIPLLEKRDLKKRDFPPSFIGGITFFLVTLPNFPNGISVTRRNASPPAVLGGLSQPKKRGGPWLPANGCRFFHFCCSKRRSSNVGWGSGVFQRWFVLVTLKSRRPTNCWVGKPP